MRADKYRIIDDFGKGTPHYFLSNFAPSPFKVGDWEFPTVEHYYQAHKAEFDEDFEDIVRATSPGAAKRLGREVEIREDWEEIKVVVMRNAMRLKFPKGSKLADKLQQTGNALLVEGNTWGDRVWGMTETPSGAMAGSNLLGISLMLRRAELNLGMDLTTESF